MATYCRICGVELSYKRTRNNHWMPCDAMTGEPHFCVKDGVKTRNSGLSHCLKCGKPVFMSHGKLVDYSTLTVHACKKADITRYSKYVEKQKHITEGGATKRKPSKTARPCMGTSKSRVKTCSKAWKDSE